MSECKIVGPYFPLGETEWRCATHDVDAILRDPVIAVLSRPRRREDFVCPVTTPHVFESLPGDDMCVICGKFDGGPQHVEEPVEGCPDCGQDTVVEDEDGVYCSSCGWRE